MSFLDPWTPNGITYKLAISASEKSEAQQFVENNPSVPDGEIGCPANVADITLGFLARQEPVFVVGSDNQGICIVAAFHELPDYRQELNYLMVIVSSDARVYGTDAYSWLVKASVRFLSWVPDGNLLVTVKYDFSQMADDIFGPGSYTTAATSTPFGDYYEHLVTVSGQCVQTWRNA